MEPLKRLKNMKQTSNLLSIIVSIFVFLSVIVGGSIVFGAVSSPVSTGPTGTYKLYTFFTATSTTATSTNTTDESGALVIAGAEKVNVFFSRGDSTGTGNTGTSTFSIQASPDGSTWYNFGKLVQATSTGVSDTDEQMNVNLYATSSAMFALDMLYDTIYSIRCIVVEGVDGNHTCKAAVEF